MPSTCPALVVFLRRPVPGVGKQRLAREIGAAAAHGIAQALLECALEDAAAWPGEVVLAPADAADEAWARGLLGPRAQVEPQRAGNLGERLQQVDLLLRGGGLERLLYMGSDAPGLLPAHFSAARAALEGSDVVLAPALDGGVTLMGARRPWPPLTALPWSSATLGGALGAACRAAGLSVTLIESSFDVDEAADLERARAATAGDTRAARRRLAELLAGMAA